jgi:hypothetical protein
MVACIQIVVRLDDNNQAVMHVGRAYRLILEAGQQALAARLADARRRRSTWKMADYKELITHAGWQLKGLDSLFGCLSIPAMRGELPELAVFAEAAAPPPALLTWLSTAAAVLLLSLAAHPHGASPPAPLPALWLELLPAQPFWCPRRSQLPIPCVC